ncbi:MAG: YbjQ family protein [Lautropia sp.]|nr:YbjQ family protein [Lautropia sp.]
MSDQQFSVVLALLFNIGLPLLLVLIAFFVGAHNERRHYASILRRERELADILTFSSRKPPEFFSDQQLVQGSVVVSSDYFKRTVAFLRQIFGGDVKSYESLLDRARREAILRMKAQARLQGADAIFNVRLDTSSLSQTAGGGGVSGTVEVLAYGTAGRLGKSD